jgi:Suppressor of fused protein (SUFU)
MGFWERTWQERGDALTLAYGETSPADTVVSFSWTERPLRCPGACALCFPPIRESRDPTRQRRDDWLYVTMGLSQPLNKEQVKDERAAGKSYSAYGIEFAFVVPTEEKWHSDALYYFMTYMTDGEEICWGDRFPFRFYRKGNGELSVQTGNPSTVLPVGSIRAVLFWPFLFPDWEFLTITGKFMIMVATGITEREWEAAKRTTSGHLLLLLCRAGIAQRTLSERECLFADPRWSEEWAGIERMSPDECEREIESGIGRWHPNEA